jgi:hypothetical protein
MDKKKTAFPLAVLLSAISGFVGAGEIPREGQGTQAAAAVAGEIPGRTPYHSVKTVYSDCQRRRVIWSGGVARRGPDRIRPRPVRSRWQGADDNRIFCTGGDPFSRKRVADEPWIR